MSTRSPKVVGAKQKGVGATMCLSWPFVPLKPKKQLIKSSLGAQGTEWQNCAGKAQGPGEARVLCQAAGTKLQTGAVQWEAPAVRLWVWQRLGARL